MLVLVLVLVYLVDYIVDVNNTSINIVIVIRCLWYCIDDGDILSIT